MESRDAVERVETTMGIIGGKWKPAIIYALVMDGTLRFMELRRRIPAVTQRMLTQQLRDLERHGLVARVHHAEIPPRVEYSVTPLGRSLHPIFKSVCDWATENFPDVEKARARSDRQKASAPARARRASSGRLT
ncbi:MAG TPA: helix-turn-helix domain-containing protein [Thermoanaerobaculia bacterium]|nr:helix-turn-helix domain-containing protein [Thermoanaerobaculia bacterium]